MFAANSNIVSTSFDVNNQWNEMSDTRRACRGRGRSLVPGPRGSGLPVGSGRPCRSGSISDSIEVGFLWSSASSFVKSAFGMASASFHGIGILNFHRDDMQFFVEFRFIRSRPREFRCLRSDRVLIVGFLSIERAGSSRPNEPECRDGFSREGLRGGEFPRIRLLHLEPGLGQIEVTAAVYRRDVVVQLMRRPGELPG